MDILLAISCARVLDGALSDRLVAQLYVCSHMYYFGIALLKEL